MENLQVLNLYNDEKVNKSKSFFNNIESNLNVKIDYSKSEYNYEWLSIMEETIRYIDNILRNPNRFIINEEDVVKVELARRITVDSIKHLARNTNLIQDIDKKTGDVKPSKILNINKEESYNTYENRFIYSLIENMKSYVALKKKGLSELLPTRDNKNMEYKANTIVGSEEINVSIMLNTKLKDNNTNINDKILERIEKLENQIIDLTSYDVYKTIHKLHVSLVTSPIKKTNVILKNTNFQYALNLWNYMQSHMDDEIKNVKNSKNDIVNGRIKSYIDETFMLDYLVVDNMIEHDDEKIDKKEVSERVINNMLQKLMELNDITLDDLKKIIDRQYPIVKNKNIISDKEIHKRFKNAITNYIDKMNEVVLE